MTVASLLLRLRCLVPGPTQHRTLVDTQHRCQALSAALLRCRKRHQSMLVLAYHRYARLKAAEAAAVDAGYAGQEPATVIYTLTGQLELARAERDEALRVARELADRFIP